MEHCEAADQEQAGRGLPAAATSPRTKDTDRSESDLKRSVWASDLSVRR